MLQKGIIEDFGSEKNKLLVRVPMYEKAGSDEVIIECSIAIQPGIVSTYNIGDIVYVAFENDQLTYPVVVSKLYTPNVDYINSKAAITADYLKVDGKVELSSDIKIGELTYTDLYSCKKELQLKDQATTDYVQANPSAPSTNTLTKIKIGDTVYSNPICGIHSLEINSSTFNKDIYDLLNVGGIGSFVYESDDDHFTTNYSAVAQAFYDKDNDSYSATVYYSVITTNGVQWVRATSGTLYYYA